MAFFFQMNKKEEIHSLSMQLQCMGTEIQKLHKHIIKVMHKKITVQCYVSIIYVVLQF